MFVILYFQSPFLMKLWLVIKEEGRKTFPRLIKHQIQILFLLDFYISVRTGYSFFLIFFLYFRSMLFYQETLIYYLEHREFIIRRIPIPIPIFLFFVYFYDIKYEYFWLWVWVLLELKLFLRHERMKLGSLGSIKLEWTHKKKKIL